jgi:hypothetical protein
MPGRLIIDDAAADLASAQRVTEFVKNRPVTAALGGHIELNAHGDTFDFGSTYHPDEHALPLSKQDLLALPARIAKFDGLYTQDGMFVMFNQYRLLAAQLAAVVLILAAIVALIWRYLRRRKRSACA